MVTRCKRHLMGWLVAGVLVLLPRVAEPAPGGEPTAASSAAPTEGASSSPAGFRPPEQRPGPAPDSGLDPGAVLLVEAYAAMWIVLFGLLALSLRRQRRLDERLDRLASALQLEDSAPSESDDR